MARRRVGAGAAREIAAQPSLGSALARGAVILAEADAVQATLIVMARVSRPGHALPYVGSQTLRVLEFAAVPVLVVPTRPR